MLSLAKIVVSGLTGLSTSGLGLYFIPRYVDEESKESKLIYGEGKSSSGASIESFEKNEKEILEEMEVLYKDFSAVAEHWETEKIKKYLSLLSIFRNIDMTEEQLKKLYEENKNFFLRVKGLNKKTFELQQKKLNVEANLKSLEYHNDLLQKEGYIKEEWKKSVKKIICAIESSSTYCKIGLDGKPLPTSQASSSSPGGGGKLPPLKPPHNNFKSLKKF